MFVYFPKCQKVVNTKAIDYVELVKQTDRYNAEHVMMRFNSGSFLEFPPDVSIQEVFMQLDLAAERD